jgi:hypothetical protein
MPLNNKSSCDVAPFIAACQKSVERLRQRALAGMNEFAQMTMGNAQERCPKLTGDLAASGKAEPAVISGDIITVLMGFSMDYAVYVHENLDAFHPNGEAKFLERAMLEMEPKFQSFMIGRIKS